MPIIKNYEIENNQNCNSDICIIGSGISSQTLASKLTNKKIIIVESGKIKFSEENQDLNHIKNTGLSFRHNHKNRIRQLGGSANLWANQLMELDEFEFSHRKWIIDNFAWPIKYEELRLLYKDVIENLYNDYFKKINFFYPDEKKNKELFLEKEFLKNNSFKLNNHFWPGKIEKFNLKTKFTKNLLNTKNIFFLENFTATKFNLDNDTHNIKSLITQNKSKTCVIKSKIFILACGAIENARIILNNEQNNKIFKNDNTGRYFMDHPRICLGTIKSSTKLPLSSLIGIKTKSYQFRTSLKLSTKLQTDSKILSSYAFLDPVYNNEDEIFFQKVLSELKKIIKMKGIPKINFKQMHFRKLLELFYLRLPPQISNSKINNLLYLIFNNEKYNFLFQNMNVNYQAEQYAHYSNRVYLSKEKDIFNQNLCNLNWQLNEIDFKTQNVFIKTLDNELKENKFLKFIIKENTNFTDASHHAGTTRMSYNREDGVVDINCKFHDINNLYIIGNSIFRNVGSANPGLTNMAISIRLANYLNKNILNV